MSTTDAQRQAAASVVESNADSGELVAVTPFWANDSYQYYAGRDDLEYAGIPEGGARWQVAAATSEHASLWLVVAHHNLGALPEHEPRRPWSRFPAADADAVRRLLRTAGVSLAVTAHHHVPAVREHGGLVELLAPPACSFPQAILWLRVGPDGTTVRSVPLSGPEGVTEAYWHAATGSPLGQGILDLVRSRLPTPATRADRSG